MGLAAVKATSTRKLVIIIEIGREKKRKEGRGNQDLAACAPLLLPANNNPMISVLGNGRPASFMGSPGMGDVPPRAASCSRRPVVSISHEAITPKYCLTCMWLSELSSSEVRLHP